MRRLFRSHSSFEFPRGNNFLSKLFEAWISVQQVEKWIDAYEIELITITVAVALLEPVQCLGAIAQPEVNAELWARELLDIEPNISAMI